MIPNFKLLDYYKYLNIDDKYDNKYPSFTDFNLNFSEQRYDQERRYWTSTTNLKINFGYCFPFVFLQNKPQSPTLWRKRLQYSNRDWPAYRNNYYSVRPAAFADFVTTYPYESYPDPDARYFFGEFPRSQVKDENLKFELENLYKTDKLPQTGKKYHFHLFIIIERNNYNYNSKEYFYKGEKYVRFEEETGYSRYYKVEPIEWIIDFSSFTAVTKEVILPEITYYNLKEYFKVYFYQDILPSVIDLEDIRRQDVFNLCEETKKIKLVDTNKIDGLVEEIKKELPYYYGEKDIKTIVNSLISEYNKSVKKSNDNELTTEQRNIELLYNELVLNLNNILDTLITNSKRNEKYYKMLSLIDEWTTILNGDIQKNIEDYNNSLSKDLVKLKTVILSYLNDSGSELIDILKSEKNKIINFIKNDNLDGYKDLADFENSFRLIYNEYLINISARVKDKEILSDIKNAYKSLLEDKYIEIRNNYIKFYLEHINEIYNYILKVGSDKEKKRAKEIIISNNKNDDLSSFTIMLNYLYRIKLDIDERIENETIINESIITKTL